MLKRVLPPATLLSHSESLVTTQVAGKRTVPARFELPHLLLRPHRRYQCGFRQSARISRSRRMGFDLPGRPPPRRGIWQDFDIRARRCGSRFFRQPYICRSHTLLTAEDRGDGRHAQLGKLDSVWAFFLDGSSPKRFVGLGRDKASARDSEFLAAGTPGYQNEGDNEPTGLHVSSGSTAIEGMPGTLQNLENPRAFLTCQHGDNVLWEIVKE